MKWGKLLRRTLAFFLAAITLWWLALTSGASAGFRRILSPGAAVPSAADRSAALTGMVGLLVGQSPYLRAGYVLRDPGGLPAPSGPAPEGGEAEPDLPLEDEGGSEDEAPLPAVTAPEDIIVQTFLPTGSSAYASSGGVFVYNRTQYALDMEALAVAPIALTGSGNGPQILIIHTHATESYTQDGQDVYEESDPYRTTDGAHNVLRVGDEMAAAFAQAGLNVLHDRTLHDYPNYNASYSRSYATVRDYLTAFPSISVVLDVHRDALVGQRGQVYKTAADEGVLPGSAQVMLVVGSNQSGGDHPDWKQNLNFAIALERELNEKTPTLARPITLRSASYNQQLLPGYLLVEVGTHGNTLQEALTAARAFAQTVSPLLSELLPAA